MPEMDGLEASKRIQETYKPEDRPRIIALSADTVQVGVHWRAGGRAGGRLGGRGPWPAGRPRARPCCGCCSAFACLPYDSPHPSASLSVPMPDAADAHSCPVRVSAQTLHERCREAGIEAFLVKPFRIEELARVMRSGSGRPLRNSAGGNPLPPVAV